MKPSVFSDNIALGKPATQLGTYRDFDAGRAVDGNTRQYLQVLSCAHPHSRDETLPADVRGSPAWWSVDLSAGDPSQTYIITSVTIYFRQLQSGKLLCMMVLFSSNNLEVQVDVNFFFSVVSHCFTELSDIVSTI